MWACMGPSSCRSHRRIVPAGRKLAAPCHALMPGRAAFNIDRKRIVRECVTHNPTGWTGLDGSKMRTRAHILVVDDEPRIRTMLRRYLVEEGFKVSDAADGSAMRAALEGGAVDLVLLDLMLP